MSNYLSIKLTSQEAENIKNKLHSYQVPNNNEYVDMFFKYKSASITLYKSLKLVINDLDPDRFLEELGLQKTISFIYNDSHCGSDEVGTGDYFGPVIVCGAYVNKNNIQELIDLGINDSKKISDEFILDVVPHLLKKYPYSVLVLDNAKYNEIKDEYNLNEMKAIMHNQVLLNLSKKNLDIKYNVVDQFCDPDKYFEYNKKQKEVIKNINFTIKGETYSIAVALASMIARYTFLTKIRELNLKYKIDLPLGSGSNVEEYGKRLINQIGKEEFKNIAKLHFKTSAKIGL